jgi:hypothetical protein
MPENVKVPGIGPVKSTYVWVAGAVVVGIVGYAWLSRGRAASAPVVDPGDVALGEPTVPVVNDSNLDLTAPSNEPRTNAEWTQRAVEFLVSGGVDGGFAQRTLGKFLGHRGLTPQEQDVVLSALAGVGAPPVGGPYPINSSPIPEPGPAPVVPYKSAVKLARVGRPGQAVNKRAYITGLSAGSGANDNTISTLLKQTDTDPINVRWRGRTEWPGGALVRVHYAVRK